VYEAAIGAGAEGGKLLGAGGGGFLLCVVPASYQKAVRQALWKLREIPFRFASQGSRIIFVHDDRYVEKRITPVSSEFSTVLGKH
jgi:D-glycero-alpha-D-manno-heptose-7-phosphate kinase